jgi:hypothetical protein
LPQHHTAPLELSAQFVKNPAVTFVKLVPLGSVTATGVLLEVLVPLPNCPYEFEPQQYGWPEERRAQAC